MALITCPECGSEVSDQAEACRQCGYPIAIQAKQGAEWNTLAIAAFVVGLASLVIPVGWLVSLVLGIMALSQMKRRNAEGLPPQKGKWMAIVGIAFGVVLLAFVAFAVILIALDNAGAFG